MWFLILISIIVLAFVVYLIERSEKASLAKEKLAVERMKIELEMERAKSENKKSEKPLMESSE